jgi:hypothetical protein
MKLNHNINNWKIKTPNGYETFAGVAYMGVSQTYKLTFNDNTNIKATDSHIFFLEDNTEIFVKNITPGIILSGIKNKTVIDIELDELTEVYDIIEIPSHTFFANGILSHNCQFISSDPLLINSLYLATYPIEQPPEPDARGIVWFDTLDPNKSYIIGIDPATGSENDYTVMSVFSFPDLEQVAEFRSNTTSSAIVYTTFKYMIKKMIFAKITNIYFSVENNGVGEGFIGIYQTDDDSPEYGEFISEEGKNRAGMNTSGKSKSKACINFKNLFEGGRIKVKSKHAIIEMKDFVRQAGSYGARRGATDDCIASMLIVVRILDELVQYEDNVYEVLYNTGLINEFDSSSKPTIDDAPTPMVIGGGFYESKYAHYKIGKFHDVNDPNSFDPWGDYPFLG